MGLSVKPVVILVMLSYSAKKLWLSTKPVINPSNTPKRLIVSTLILARIIIKRGKLKIRPQTKKSLNPLKRPMLHSTTQWTWTLLSTRSAKLLTTLQKLISRNLSHPMPRRPIPQLATSFPWNLFLREPLIVAGVGAPNATTNIRKSSVSMNLTPVTTPQSTNLTTNG